jgi:hypothetical protein
MAKYSPDSDGTIPPCDWEEASVLWVGKRAALKEGVLAIWLKGDCHKVWLKSIVARGMESEARGLDYLSENHSD